MSDNSNENVSASAEIDQIIKNITDWRSGMLSRLREIVLETDSEIIEMVKWKKPSKPEGVPVWFFNGNICIADTLKKAIRLTFPKGANIKDPEGIFNTRLDSKSVRAIDFFENDEINASALAGIVKQAILLNRTGEK